MTEVVSIRFKPCGKNYFFSPDSIQIEPGMKVVVETAKGLEMAECTYGNHWVEDTAVVQPLRSVIRIATPADLQTVEQNKSREKEAFSICQKKIEEHKLDMKLVSVELSFDGSKTLFFFTSDGRVDFRELVKELASIFHNRIELRQIGVRDEAKMIGGIGICGRPYCCNAFLNDFAPVSTKMAKVQNLSLNPTKISGSCGRLMCCLRYEEDAYEDLVKTVPKEGAFVETPDGYGTVQRIGLLRQRVDVHLDGEPDNAIKSFKAKEVAAVPGGRPKDGEPYPHVLEYIPEDEDEEPAEDPWATPSLFAEPFSAKEISVPSSAPVHEEVKKHSGRNARTFSEKSEKKERKHDDSPEKKKEKPVSAPLATPESVHPSVSENIHNDVHPEKSGGRNSRYKRHKPSVKGGKNSEAENSQKKNTDSTEKKPEAESAHHISKPGNHKHHNNNHKPKNNGDEQKSPAVTSAPAADGVAAEKNQKSGKPYHHRHYGHRPKKSGGNGGSGSAPQS